MTCLDPINNLRIMLRSRECWIQNLERLVYRYVDLSKVEAYDAPFVQCAKKRGKERAERSAKERAREERRRRERGARITRSPGLSFKPVHALPRHWKG